VDKDAGCAECALPSTFKHVPACRAEAVGGLDPDYLIPVPELHTSPPTVVAVIGVPFTESASTALAVADLIRLDGEDVTTSELGTQGGSVAHSEVDGGSDGGGY